MSEYTPTTDEVREGYAYYLNHRLLAEFDRWLAEVERAAAERAWDSAWREVQGIPHWWNPGEQRGGFDIPALGCDASSEEGAYMEIRRVLLENPYRREGKHSE